MTAKALKEAMQRVESWPQEAQEELAEIAFEIDARLKGGKYHATPEELAGIDAIPNKAKDHKIDVALTNSFGFGGHNSTLAFTAYQE